MPQEALLWGNTRSLITSPTSGNAHNHLPKVTCTITRLPRQVRITSGDCPLPAKSNLPMACQVCVWSWAKEERHPDVPRGTELLMASRVAPRRGSHRYDTSLLFSRTWVAFHGRAVQHTR